MTDETNTPPQTGNAPTAYDPSAHTVPEVTEYLATADADEVERVKSVEKDGKKRSGVLDWEAPAPDEAETTTLRVHYPWWTTDFRFQKDPADSGNGHWVITRGGTEVPSDLAETIINAAANSGVTVLVVEPEPDVDEED